MTCADGEIEKVELNTGAGLPGTNYRLVIKVAKNLELDYHFEIGGSVSEPERNRNILVSKGSKFKRDRISLILSLLIAI